MLMPRPIPVFVGSLVTLRGIDVDRDAADFYTFNLDPEMHLWTNNSPFPTVAAARDELARLAGLEDVSTWMIVENASGRVVGRFFLTLELRDGRRVVGDGNRIARPLWRKGHNREARRLMLRYAFTPPLGGLGADVYETRACTENVSSCRSIEAHGFRFLGERDEMFAKIKQMVPVRRYAMTREEYLANRALW